MKKTGKILTTAAIVAICYSILKSSDKRSKLNNLIDEFDHDLNNDEKKWIIDNLSKKETLTSFIKFIESSKDESETRLENCANEKIEQLKEMNAEAALKVSVVLASLTDQARINRANSYLVNTETKEIIYKSKQYDHTPESMIKFSRFLAGSATEQDKIIYSIYSLLIRKEAQAS